MPRRSLKNFWKMTNERIQQIFLDYLENEQE